MTLITFKHDIYQLIENHAFTAPKRCFWRFNGGGIKKADAFFMLVLFYWGECWGVVGPPKRNRREKGMEEAQHLPK